MSYVSLEVARVTARLGGGMHINATKAIANYGYAACIRIMTKDLWEMVQAVLDAYPEREL